MFEIENILIILDFLNGNSSKNISVVELSENLAFSKKEIVESLMFLLKIGIVKKENNNYILEENIKAIHLAQASHYGIDLTSYSKFNISEEQKKLAITLADKVEEIKNNQEKKRWALLQQRRGYLNSFPKDEIMGNLFFLYEAANTTLFEYITQNFADDEFLKVLIELHSQAEEQLNNYSQKK